MFRRRRWRGWLVEEEMGGGVFRGRRWRRWEEVEIGGESV